MGVSATYRLHSIVLDQDGSAGLGPVLLRGLTSKEITSDSEVVQDLTGSSVLPTSARVIRRNAGLNFSSFDLDTVLRTIPLTGVCGGITDVYFALHDCGGIPSGAVHKRYRIRGTAIALDNLTAAHQGDATISGRVLAVGDGVNAPVEVAFSTLPNPSGFAGYVLADGETARWYMREATTNGVLTTGKQNFNLNYNPTISSVGADGEDYDTWTTIDSVLPEITVDGINLNWFNLLGFNFEGDSVEHLDTIFNFAKRKTADAVAGHIKISASGVGFMETFASGGSPTTNATASFRIATSVDTNGNFPILFTLNTTLP